MRTLRTLFAIAAIVCITSTGRSLAQENASSKEPLGIALEGYPYPYPVAYLPLQIEGQDLRMAYMDVAPESGQAKGTVLLLHGKNFFGAYWHQTIRALTAAGFRVIVPDQIGFGKSSKPDIHYSFHQLAANTRKLLDHLKVSKVAVVGHSMGGMLATRFVLMYPDIATHLVLENSDRVGGLPPSTLCAYGETLRAGTEPDRRAAPQISESLLRRMETGV